MSLELDEDKQYDSDRDEPQDDRPGLVAHDISDQHDGPPVAFYDPEGGALDGEIIYTEKTVDVGRFR